MIERKGYESTQFPEYLVVEATNRCNLNCLMCDRSITTETIQNIDFGLYRKIIDESAQNGNVNLFLQFLGEPMLNPQLVPMIKYSKQQGIPFVSVTTNGTFLNKNNLAEDLLSSGIDEINISIDGATRDTYEAIRVGASLERVEANTRLLLAKRKGDKPSINLAYCQSEENEGEDQMFVNKWVNVVDSITLKAGMNPNREMIRKDRADSDRERVPCMDLWSVFVIYSNGNVGICCEELGSKTIEANITEQSIREVWISPQYEQIRKNQLNGIYTIPDICTQCEYWRRANDQSGKNEIYTTFRNPILSK